MWSWFLGISLIIFIFTITMTILKYLKNTDVLEKIPGTGMLNEVLRNFLEDVPVFYFLCGGVFIAIFFALIPIVLEEGFVVEKFSIPLFNSMLIFMGERDFEYDLIPASGFWHSFYSAYLSILYILGPLLTIGFVAQIFSNWISLIQYWTFKNREAYIFSELDTRTLITAQDLKKKKEKVLILFMDAHEDDEKQYLWAEAKELGAIVLNKDIKNFNFGKRYAKTNILLCRNNDIDNVTDMMTLITEKKLEHLSKEFQTDIYVFSSTEEYENVVSSFIQDNEDLLHEIKIIIVDEIHNISYKLFKHYPLYGDLEKGEIIRLLVIGDSRLAKELVRVASWCGQMETHELEIVFLSENADSIKEDFEFLYPEINKNCKIEFIQRGTAELKSVIKEKQPTYLIIADEDELLNLKTGIEVATESKRNELISDVKAPQIFIWNKSPGLKEQLTRLRDNKNNSYHLIPFGGIEEQFKSNNIFNSKLDEQGKAVHFFYDDFTKKDFEDPKMKEKIKESEKTYYNSEYNRKSSIAAALHEVYRIEDVRLLEDSEEPLDHSQYLDAKKNHLNELMRLEHKRWAAYMRARGFKALDLEDMRRLIKDKKLDRHRSDQLKLHSTLVDWNPKINNPLEENGINYENATHEEIKAWLNGEREEIDDLDRVTLTCWEIKKFDLPENFEVAEAMEDNFKTTDLKIVKNLDLFPEP